MRDVMPNEREEVGGWVIKTGIRLLSRLGKTVNERTVSKILPYTERKKRSPRKDRERKDERDVREPVSSYSL